MKIKIESKNQYDDNENTFYMYKVKYKNEFLFIAEGVFVNLKDLIQIDSDFILLKEPFDTYYSITITENKNGKYKFLIPKESEEFKIKKEKQYKDKKEDQNIRTNKHRESKTQLTKLEFISGLLDYSAKKKVDNQSKERLVKLIGNELKNAGGFEKEILDRLGRIEGKLKDKSESKTNYKNGLSDKSKSFPEPNPKHVADFMSLFNQRDGLKYLTHDFDEEGDFNIENFLSTANKLFEKKTKELSIPISIWTISNMFAFTDKPSWTYLDNNYNEQKVNSGWSTDEWKQWSQKNKLHPIRNDEFKSIINDFKRLTRIEKPNLELLIDKCISVELGDSKTDFNIVKKDIHKADFYTHVYLFKIALETIFEEVKKRTDSEDKKQISIQYERESTNDYFLRKVIINHKKSYPSKELSILNKEWRTGKGNMGKIAEKLKGYCHWSVETKIEDKPIRVNILKEKDVPEYENIQEATGFTHVLTFYYK